MAQASRDENSVPTLLAASNADGITPVRVYADPTTHRLLVDIASGSGTVTSVSVVTANGFAGSVANPTSTPAITLSTTVSGILKGNGTAMSAAVANTDYQVPITLTTTGTSGAATFNGTTLNIPQYQAAGTYVTSVSGTTNRITSSGGTTPVIDIAATYVGQTSLTTLGTIATGVWQGTKVGLAYGGTNADLSATGGAANYLKQVSSGAAVTVGTIPASDIASGAALTKVDDTNVTLTLGGTPTTALLAATSLTLGWTGSLAATRGGTGQTTYAKGDILASPGSNTLNKLTVGNDGEVLTADAASTNGVKWAAVAAGTGITIGTTTITSGTNTRILYDNAGVVGEYTLTGTGTVVAMQTAPTFLTSITTSAANLITDTTTGTKIGTATNQKLGFYNSTPIVQPTGDVTTALTNLGLVATPTINADTVSSANEATDTSCFPLFITASGTQTLATKNNTSFTFNSNTATLGSTIFNAGTGFQIGAAAASRKMLVGNGTNFVASTETWAVPGTSGNVLTSDGTNWTSAAPAGGGSTASTAFATDFSVSARLANFGTNDSTTTVPTSSGITISSTDAQNGGRNAQFKANGALCQASKNYSVSITFSSSGVLSGHQTFVGLQDMGDTISLSDSAISTSSALVMGVKITGDGTNNDITSINADGAGNETSNVLINNQSSDTSNTVTMVVTGTTSIKFYLNGTLVNTHTTNLPTTNGGAGQWAICVAGRNNAGSGTCVLTVSSAAVTQLL